MGFLTLLGAGAGSAGAAASSSIVAANYGPLTTSSAMAALGEPYSLYEEEAIALGEYQWAFQGADFNGDGTNQGDGGGAYYDRPMLFYTLWYRTGDSKWKTRGDALLNDLVTNYFVANDWGTSFIMQWANPRSLYLDWLMNGTDLSKTGLGRLSDWIVLPYLRAQISLINTTDEPTMADADPRAVARGLLCHIYAVKAGATGTLGYDKVADRDFIFEKMINWQTAAGAQRSPPYSGSTPYPDKPFISQIANDALIEYYEQVTPDSRIPTYIKKNIDYEMANNWVESAGAFKYLTTETTQEPTSDGLGTTPAADLNGFFPHIMAWYYSVSGDTTYRDYADKIYPYISYGDAQRGKPYNELFATGSSRYKGYRGTAAYSYHIPNRLKSPGDFTVSANWGGGSSAVTKPAGLAGPNGRQACRFAVSNSASHMQQNVVFPRDVTGTWRIWAKSSATGGASNFTLWTKDQTEATVIASQRFTLTSSWQELKLTAVLLTATVGTYVSLVVFMGDNNNGDYGNVDIAMAYLGTGSGSLPGDESTVGDALAGALAWSPTGKSSRVTIDSTGLILTNNLGAGTYTAGSAFMTKTGAGQKVMWGVTINQLDVSIGVAQASANVDGYVGNDSLGLGYASAAGFLYRSSAYYADWPTTTPGVGDTAFFILSADGTTIWFGRRASGSSTVTWGGDPSAGTGGMTLPSGTWKPAGSVANTGTNGQITIVNNDGTALPTGTIWLGAATS